MSNLTEARLSALGPVEGLGILVMLSQVSLRRRHPARGHSGKVPRRIRLRSDFAKPAFHQVKPGAAVGAFAGWRQRAREAAGADLPRALRYRRSAASDAGSRDYD